MLANIAELPFEDDTFPTAILSRALWAVDYELQLKEVYRIMTEGGQLIVCESFNRWWKDETNTLIESLKQVGFVIRHEDGTAPDNESDEVFQYIIAMKPVQELRM